jgi:hypothetical protein
MDQVKNNIRSTALNIALGYIGKEEVPRGSNAGEFVEACLKLVNLPGGHAWCQAFAYRVLSEAAALLSVANPMPKTAGVLDCWNKTSPNNRLLKIDSRPTNVLSGFQFIYDHGKGLGHTGFVVEVFPDGSFSTIEGNTDPSGSRNGYCVAKLKRNISDPKLRGFIMY